MNNYYDPGTGDFVVLDGNIVERDALRIAEAIRDYDPNLVLLCLDPERATGISDEPFVVAERGNDGILRPAFKAWVLDDTLLERIFNSDTHRFDVLNALVNTERNERKAIETRYQEKREETKDIVAHIAGMKSRYSVKDPDTGDLITFYDDRPAERM